MSIEQRGACHRDGEQVVHHAGHAPGDVGELRRERAHRLSACHRSGLATERGRADRQAAQRIAQVVRHDGEDLLAVRTARRSCSWVYCSAVMSSLRATAPTISPASERIGAAKFITVL